MFGMGMGELLVVLVIALIILGPQRLPEAAKAVGKGIRELRRHTRDLEETLEQDAELGGTVRDLKSALRGDFMRPGAILRHLETPEVKPQPAAMPATNAPSPNVVPPASAPPPLPPAASAAHAPAPAAAQSPPAGGAPADKPGPTRG